MVKQIIKNVLKEKGHFVIAPTKEARIKALIERLHPYRLEKDLIRIGPNGDGGYLVPNDLDGIKACFSPGVDQISEFEKECLNLGMDVYMADKSVERPNLDIDPSRYDFIKKYIGCTNNEDFITMDAWVDSSKWNAQEDLLLQMDIEGGEYHSLINISDNLMKRFRIMVFEFHFLDHFWNPHFFNTAEAVFDKILQTHACVHIHPNNYSGIKTEFGIALPTVAEFTFLRKDRAEFTTYETRFPHPLDYDNCDHEHVVLPRNWYR